MVILVLCVCVRGGEGVGYKGSLHKFFPECDCNFYFAFSSLHFIANFSISNGSLKGTPVMY